MLSGCVSTLESAVESGDYEAVKQEIAKGGNVDGSYWTSIKLPLQRAIENDDLEMVKLLHESGAEIGPGAASVAVKVGAISTYAYLVENGADLNGCYLDTDYPNWWGGAEVGSVIPPLGSAVMRQDVQSVATLLELGAPLESDCIVPAGLGDDYRFSSILAAGIAGDPDVIELLIRAGAEPNRLSTQGRTPLSLAAERGHYHAVRVLLANGAFHTYTTQIQQPIEYALEAGHDDVVYLLTYAGAVRPQRRDPSATMVKVGSAVWEGVKFAAGLYVIYLGARYAGYDPEYVSNIGLTGGDSNGSQTLANRSRETRSTDRNSECGGDWDCNGVEICVKQPLHSRGICVDDGGETRLSRDYDSVQSGQARSDHPKDQKDCPLGTHWDLIYAACIN
jgi:ankyrin repeat protein